MAMTVNRKETLQIDPIPPVLHSHSALECQAMASVAPGFFAPRLLDLLRSPDQQAATVQHGEASQSPVAGVAGPCRTLETAANPYQSSSVRYISYAMRPRPTKSSDYAQDNSRLTQYIRNMCCLRCPPA